MNNIIENIIYILMYFNLNNNLNHNNIDIQIKYIQFCKLNIYFLIHIFNNYFDIINILQFKN